jgi:Na+/proline symporter
MTAAFACGLLPVVLACVVRDHGTANDPAMVFHRYTLLHVSGPQVLLYIGAPAYLSVILAVLLRRKTSRRSLRVDRAAWCLVVFICLLCLFSMFVEGLAALPVAVLVVCAAATARMPADPNERLLRQPSFFDRAT